MSYTYAQKKRTSPQTGTQTHSGGAMDSAVPNSTRLAALESGQISPTAADKGNRVDLPEAMRAKMESSFGMDFSGVKLYESKLLGQTGAEAMAQGNEIAFAPGKLDFASQSGQAKLGHEFSHIASQARGEVHGNGFLLDSGLEARADREGAMAARGESVYGDAYGGAVAPLSAASAAPMAGPMQAKKGKGKKEDTPAPIRHVDVQDREFEIGKMIEQAHSLRKNEMPDEERAVYKQNLKDLSNYSINNGGQEKTLESSSALPQEEQTNLSRAFAELQDSRKATTYIRNADQMPDQLLYHMKVMEYMENKKRNMPIQRKYKDSKGKVLTGKKAKKRQQEEDAHMTSEYKRLFGE